MTTQTREDLKNKAKLIRNFLEEKCNSQISHSQGLELISNVFGFKDWNTASALLSKDVAAPKGPTKITTVGELRNAIDGLDDSVHLDAEHSINIYDFLKEADIDQSLSPEDEISYEFSFVLDQSDSEFATLKLYSENESKSMHNNPIGAERMKNLLIDMGI
jgi:hypothetical protein